MTVTFQPNWRDNLAAARLMGRRPLRASLVKWLVVMVLLLPHGLRSWKGLVSAVLFTLIWELGFYSMTLHQHKSSFERFPILSRIHHIRISDEGLAIYSDSGEPLPWSWVERVVEARTHFFVVVALQPEIHGNKLPHAIAIPKRAFDSSSHAADFGALLKRKWAQHHVDAAPISPPS